MTENGRDYVYWCPTCKVPLLQLRCGNCGNRGNRMVTDLRPVFDEEKRLLEALTDEALPEDTSLLWMLRRTLWYNGERYLRFSGDTGDIKPEVMVRYGIQSIPCARRNDNFVKVLTAANNLTLSKLEDEAIQFINQVASQFDECVPAVSFSGGKDSVVVSQLVRKALGSEAIPHIFGDTSNEFPDTYEFIENFFSDNPDIPLIREESGRDWFSMCDILQPPSRLTAWCCSVFKSVPLAKAIKRISPHGRVLSFEGVRRSESTRRAGRPAIATQNKIAKQIIARPILHWRDIDVWVYTLANNLPVNMAYKRGLTRVGCLYCPYHDNRIDWWLQLLYPGHTEKWKAYIVEYARNRRAKSDPEDYWSSGAWRARVGNNGMRPRGHLEQCSLVDGSTDFVLQREFESDKLEHFLKPFGHVDKVQTPIGQYFNITRNGSPLFRLEGRDGFAKARLRIAKQTDRRGILLQVARQLRKYQACVYCGVCEAVCPFGAISVHPEFQQWTIDNKLCTHCMECVNGKHIKGGCVAINTSYGKTRLPTMSASQTSRT